MRIFEKPMAALSVLPALPILFFGGVIAIDGFWSSISGDFEQLAQLLIWMLGVCGIVGLMINSLEKTSRNKTGKLISLVLIACGISTLPFSFIYVFYFTTQNTGANSTSKVLFLVAVVWICLMWPLFYGVIAIGDFVRNRQKVVSNKR